MKFRYASSHWPLSVGEQVAEVQAVGQLQHRPPVPIVGPDRAFSTTPHGVTIGPDESGDLRPRQPRLPLGPFQPLREILGEDLGSSTVVCALSRHGTNAPRAQPYAVSYAGEGIPFPYRSYRGRSGSRSERLPCPFILACFFFCSPLLAGPVDGQFHPIGHRPAVFRADSSLGVATLGHR